MIEHILLDLLSSVDTPTVCNAIEVAEGKRGFNRFTKGTLLCSDIQAGAICGYARTAKIAATQPPTDTPDVIRSRRMAYYKHMAEAPSPAIAIVEDTDFPECIGAYWGEINTTIHKGFGISGALTNGVMRDLGDLPDDFPVIAGSIGPSHGFVHVLEVGQPIEIFGLQINDGDFVHADRHGAVVVPPDIMPVLGDAIKKLLATEAIILEPARQDNFDFAAFEAAWAEFEKART